MLTIASCAPGSCYPIAPGSCHPIALTWDSLRAITTHTKNATLRLITKKERRRKDCASQEAACIQEVFPSPGHQTLKAPFINTKTLLPPTFVRTCTITWMGSSALRESLRSAARLSSFLDAKLLLCIRIDHQTTNETKGQTTNMGAKLLQLELFVFKTFLKSQNSVQQQLQNARGLVTLFWHIHQAVKHPWLQAHLCAGRKVLLTSGSDALPDLTKKKKGGTEAWKAVHQKKRRGRLVRFRRSLCEQVSTDSAVKASREESPKAWQQMERAQCERFEHASCASHMCILWD
eukprot:1160498-Pelagomonas_calceolata.AAC.10